MDAQGRCDLLFATQHGALSRAQALEAGMTERMIQVHVDAGRWVLARPGVYRHRAVPPSRLGTLSELQLWAGPDAFFSHRTGAELWGLDGAPGGHLEICTYSGPPMRHVKRHRLSADDRPDIVHIEGLRVASVERVLIDLAGVERLGVLGRCLDDALRKQLTTLSALDGILDELGGRGRNGTRALRTMVQLRDDRDGKTASRMEARMLRILRSIDHVRWVPQFCVQTGGGRFYLDFACPEARLGIECHSVRWHMGQDRFKSDLRRDRKLKLAGWTILYFSWDDLSLRRAETETEIRRALRNLPV